MPYEPIKITFNLDFMDGEFKIADYDIKDYRVIEDGEKICRSKSEIIYSDIES